MDSKTCTKCGLSLPIDMFYLVGRNVKQWRAACKTCCTAYTLSRSDELREYKRRYAQENSWNLNELRRIRRQKARKAAILEAWEERNKQRIDNGSANWHYGHQEPAAHSR